MTQWPKNSRLKANAVAGNLQSEEAFLLSRIGAGITIGEALELCPWEQEQTLKIISTLHDRKILEISKEVSSDPRLAEDEKIPALEQLDCQFRIEIWNKFEQPDEANPYEVLEANPHWSASTLKQQYLSLSKRFHPDRFFTKELGHYKLKLEKIFSRIQKAYAVLKDPSQKNILDQKLSLATAKSKENAPQIKVKSMDLLMEKMGRAETYYKAGLEAQKNGDFLAALNSFNLAVQLNPSRESYKEALNAVKEHALKQKSKQSIAALREAAETGYTTEIFQKAEEAFTQNKDLPEAQILVAQGILEMGHLERLKDAREMLLRAKAKLPSDPSPCYWLARVYHAMDDTGAAKKMLKEALQRRPNYSPAKTLLDKL